MDRRIGAQLYTVRDSIQTVKDFDKSCRKIKDIGYQLIQISGTSLAAEDMKPVIDKYGLKVVVTHEDYEVFRDDPERIIAYNKTLGCDLCGIGYLPKEYRENIGSVIEEINRAAEVLQKEGLYLGYHNHAFEFSKRDGKFLMDRLIEETDPEKVKFIVDTYWLQVGGMDPEGYIRKLSERAMAVHLKDLKVKIDNHIEMAELGEGNLDWDGILRACEEAGVSWALVEQDDCQRDPFEALKISHDYLVAKGFQ